MTLLRWRKSTLLLPIVAVAIVLTACGGGAPSVASPRSTDSSYRVGAGGNEAAYVARVRDAVIHGAATDFAIGTGIGGPSFEACVKGGLRRALDAPTIGRLVAIYRRPGGAAYAAQALNRLAAPLAARCGHRSWVPELVEAARGLGAAGPIGAAAEGLGVTYGPYLGRRCRHLHRGCGLVGIDVVFGRAATRVEATAGSQTIRLRTPGRHNGVKDHDWVGTFTRTGFARTSHPHRDRVYVPVELRVHFVDGRHARARFPRVPVSSGWG